MKTKQLVKVPGIITNAFLKTSGFWILKKTVSMISVELEEETYNRLLNQKIINTDGQALEVPRIIEIGIDKEFHNPDKFQTGTKVEIDFEISGPIGQFFQGDKAISLVNMRVAA